jgi:hypothetical protein
MRKQIENILAELLYHHNCVIIPGLGGFVANDSPAYFQEERQTVHPASKRLAFNQSLKDNDGLLVNALAKNVAISYAEAELELKRFKDEILDKLQTYRNFELCNIGTLYLKPEGKLLFVPYFGQNFLDQSYGLPSVKLRRLPGVQDDSVERNNKIRKKLLKPKTQAPTVISSPKRSKERIWLNAAATVSSVFGIILLGLIGVFLTQSYPQAGFDVTDHKPVSHSDDQNTELASAFSVADSPVNLPEDENIIDELYPPIRENSDLENATARSSEEQALPKTESSELQTLMTEYRNSSRQRFVYHVVCLKTKNKTEAESMARALKARQFDAEILDQVKAGWYYLSAEQLYNEQSAQQFATLFKQSENKDPEIIKLSLSK